MTLVKGNVNDGKEQGAPDVKDELLYQTIAKLQEKIEKMESEGKKPEITAKDIAELLVKNNGRTETEKYATGAFVDAADIDPDDYDEDGTTFFSYDTGYVIVDDKRNGHAVRTPYGNAIKFTYQASKRIQIGKREEISNFASYTSHSKKETQWLKDYKYFGVIIFESTRQALSQDAFKAQKLVKHINSLANMSQTQIIQRCKAAHMPITSDVKEMRIALAHKLAETDMIHDREQNQIKLKASNERELFENK